MHPRLDEHGNPVPIHHPHASTSMDSWENGFRTAIAVPDSPKPPRRRITLALPLLAAAEGAVLVAAGAAKRDALARLAAGDPELPGSALGGLTVVSDA